MSVDYHDSPIISVMGYAWRRGQETAQALVIGDIFLGAIPAAEKEFPRCEFMRRLFVSGYLFALPKGIHCAWETNAIVGFDRS